MDPYQQATALLDQPKSLPVVPFNLKSTKNSSSLVERELLELAAHDVVVISCIDFREKPREGYLLTSAGNVPHGHMLEDLHLIIKDKKALVFRCHTDCAKSKAELPKDRLESDFEYTQRLERHTINRLWRDAQVLLSDPIIMDEIRKGMKFYIGRFHTHSKSVEYFKDESERLVAEYLGYKIAA